MHIVIALIVAAAIVVAGFSFSLVAPRWVSYHRRTAVMVAIWIASLMFATGAVAAIA